MEFFIPIVLFILIIFLLGLFIKFIKFIYKKSYKKLAVFIAILPLLLLIAVGYATCRVLYPPDSFYVEDFEKYSGIKFPSTGKILKKAATYPDIHGKYVSTALVRFSDVDFQQLKNDINSNSLYKLDTAAHFYGNTMELLNEHTLTIKGFEVIYIKHGLKLFVIGFYKDGQTILFEKQT